MTPELVRVGLVTFFATLALVCAIAARYYLQYTVHRDDGRIFRVAAVAYGFLAALILFL